MKECPDFMPDFIKDIISIPLRENSVIDILVEFNKNMHEFGGVGHEEFKDPKEIYNKACNQLRTLIEGELKEKKINIDAIKLPQGISPIERGGYKEPYVKGLEEGIKIGVRTTLKDIKEVLREIFK